MSRSVQTRTYRATWSDSADARAFVREHATGEVLNLCSGRSPIGDVRVDIDQSLAPDLVAGATEPLPFGENSFDTVYCDPPFGVWSTDASLPHRLWDIARDRLILQTGLEKIHIPRSEKSVFINEPVGQGLSLQLFQVFDRDGSGLDAYNGGAGA